MVLPYGFMIRSLCGKSQFAFPTKDKSSASWEALLSLYMGGKREESGFMAATAAGTAGAMAATAAAIGAADTFFAAFLGFINIESGTAKNQCDRSDENNIHKHKQTSSLGDFELANANCRNIIEHLPAFVNTFFEFSEKNRLGGRNSPGMTSVF